MRAGVTRNKLGGATEVLYLLWVEEAAPCYMLEEPSA